MGITNRTSKLISNRGHYFYMEIDNNSLKFLIFFFCGVRKEKILKTPCPIGFEKKKKG